MFNPQLLLWSITAALAGFLFGFDTVVISGAEQKIQDLWGLSPGIHGLAVGMALWGTVLGALIGGWPTQHWGRRRTLVSIGILYLVSAVGSALAPEVYSFMLARFIGGLGVGISTIAAPCYISEIAPPHLRGRLAGMFQFNIVFGILVAFLSNFLLGGIGEHAWRWMLGVEAVPALIYALMCFAIPESPRWLIVHGGNRAAGIAILRLIDPEADDASLEAQADDIAASAGHTDTKPKFFSPRLRVPILLAFLIAFFNQMSGINAVLYFAPRIFQLTGLDQSAALLQSVGIGFVNLFFTFVGLYLIDKLGRRTLLYIGSVGYILSLGLCAWAFFTYAAPFNVAAKAIAVIKSAQAGGDDLDAATSALTVASQAEGYAGDAIVIPEGTSLEAVAEIAMQAKVFAAEASGSGGLIVLICIFAFIAAHAVGQGAVIWVFISEIFPNRERAAGQVIGCGTHWVFAAIIATTFPIMVTLFAPGIVFGFFCFMMVLQLIWVKLMVPETKNLSLEEIQRNLGIK